MQDHEPWLRIAQEDLKVAKISLPEELFSPVTYHCQQAAEKSLKGYLAYKKQPIQQGKSVTAPNEKETTPLMYAVKKKK